MIIQHAAPVSAAAAGRFKGSPSRTDKLSVEVEKGSAKGMAKRVGGGRGAEGLTHTIRPGKKKWEWLGTRCSRVRGKGM